MLFIVSLFTFCLKPNEGAGWGRKQRIYFVSWVFSCLVNVLITKELKINSVNFFVYLIGM